MTRGLGGQSPANVQRYLAGVQYPARTEDLVTQAKRNQSTAVQDVMKPTAPSKPSLRHRVRE